MSTSNYISTISIKARIYFGFIFISFFLLIITIFAYQAIVEREKGFEKVDAINKKSQYILSIDSYVSDLQRSVENYSHTGYEAVAEKVKQEIEIIKSSLNEGVTIFDKNEKASDYINRMQKHIDNYQNILQLVIIERRKRNKLIEEISFFHKSLSELG